LRDIIDPASVQPILEPLSALTNLTFAIIDTEGRILASTGWHDICEQFHRVHPQTRQHCIESDTALSSGIPAGEYRQYKCKNNMWDRATPIVINEQHVGNLFIGQFFFADETVDRELFREQAQRYGFDEAEYLAALDRVPRCSRETIENVSEFCVQFAQLISRLSLSNLQLSRSKSSFQRQLTEKGNLLREVHHRIKNNILTIENFIFLQAESSESTEAATALQETLGRVKSMRLLYDKLLIGKEYQQVSVKEYLENLVETLVAVFHHCDTITIDKQIEDFSLNTRVLVPLGIIINEVMTNVVKYAFDPKQGGHIAIDLRKDENHVTLTVQDNGKGLPDGFDMDKSTGFGFEIIKMLTEQIGGTYTITDNGGTRNVLEFDA